MSELNLFASSSGSGSQDFKLENITRVKKSLLTFKSGLNPLNMTTYSSVYFNSTAFQFSKNKTFKTPSVIFISLKYNIINGKDTLLIFELIKPFILSKIKFNFLIST
jgi:hypothetical protein